MGPKEALLLSRSIKLDIKTERGHKEGIITDQVVRGTILSYIGESFDFE